MFPLHFEGDSDEHYEERQRGGSPYGAQGDVSRPSSEMSHQPDKEKHRMNIWCFFVLEISTHVTLR